MSVGIINKQTGDRIPTAGMPAIDDALDLTSVNPVQNAIITAALANKQDKTDNALQTTDKTIVGAINEHEGDIDSLKSGLMGQITTYDNVTIAAGSSIWVTNLPKNKFYCAYAKTSAVMAYIAEAIESDSLQLYARNFDNDSITTTIYLKEIG